MSRLIVAYHHGDPPAALLAAVGSAVAEGGVSGVSLRDVATSGFAFGHPAYFEVMFRLDSLHPGARPHALRSPAIEDL